MKRTKKVTIQWPFMLAAIIVMIVALDITWWQAILLTILASFNITLTFEEQ